MAYDARRWIGTCLDDKKDMDVTLFRNDVPPNLYNTTQTNSNKEIGVMGSYCHVPFVPTVHARTAINILQPQLTMAGYCVEPVGR